MFSKSEQENYTVDFTPTFSRDQLMPKNQDYNNS